jgi:hypothetical protein
MGKAQEKCGIRDVECGIKLQKNKSPNLKHQMLKGNAESAENPSKCPNINLASKVWRFFNSAFRIPHSAFKNPALRSVGERG